MRRTWTISILLLCFGSFLSAADYLPLQADAQWVLKHPGATTPVTIEITSKSGSAYRVVFTHPWGENEWDLEQRGNKIYMTGYGQHGQIAPMPADTVFFSFAGNQGESWKNAIGTLSVVSTHASVSAQGKSFNDCIQIRQVSGKTSFYYTFAPGIGFVQFGEGRDAFVLDAGSSRLPGQTIARGPASDDSPVQHVPGGNILAGANSSVPMTNAAPHKSDSRPLNIGITVSTFANEKTTPQNLLKRFEQASQAGITFLSAAQKWTEIEQKPGQYNLEGLDFQVATADRLNIPMSVTLRMIDTVDRVLPNDVKMAAWDSPQMQQRVLPLIDAMSSHFRGRVKWFMFGNEIDGYFGRHPDEIPAFARLLALVKQHVKQHSTQTIVSSTLMFGGIDSLNGALSSLNSQFEFVSITYYPIRSNFTMKPPSVVFADFGKIRNLAAGRKVILQEIGYPSSSLNDSSQDRQAEFYKDVFQAMRQNRDVVEAGSFFLLGDLPDQFVKDLAGFYGMPSQKVFLAFLQTLGMFDMQGQPKKSWTVFRSEMAQQHSAR
jgi:hypothetical protein